MDEKTEAPLTQGDYRYLNSRMDSLQKEIDDIRKRLRLLVRILVDKKIVGEETARSVQETKASDSEVIDWWLKELEVKK